MQPKRKKPVLLTCRRIGCFALSIPCAIIALFLIFLSILSPPAQAALPPQPLPADFAKGISYVSRAQGAFASATSDQTLSDVVLPTGANWLALIVTCYQDSLTSTHIDCQNDPRTATDDDLRHVVRRAHDLGLKVMLKPQLDPLHLADATSGRYDINFGSDERTWAAWFASYTRFITHYAALAEELGAEYFAVGTELGGTVGRADQWRSVIHQVRTVYSGRLTYAALTYFEPLEVTWWDDLDTIGIDAYYALTLTRTPTLAQMELGWSPLIDALSALSAHWNKPILLTEVGYMSVDGANILPGDWSLDGAVDLQEQADAYQSLFESFEGRDWWRGVFWWSLSTDPHQGGAADRGYSFHDKPAEAVLRRFFSAGS